VSKRSIAIIQARMRSTRLPGKILKTLGDKSCLGHVITRCKAIPGIDNVCCAIPEEPQSDLIAEETLKFGALVSRGDEHDVLGRYYKAAQETNADVIMRITSDCPLTDPYVSGKVLRALLEGDYEYACNNMPASYPHGLDSEAFTFDALERAYRTASTPHEREHVTPWLRNTLGVKKTALPRLGGKLSEMRWTLDFPEDFAFFEALFKVQPDLGSMYGYNEIIDLLSHHSEIAKINLIHHNVSRPGIA